MVENVSVKFGQIPSTGSSDIARTKSVTDRHTDRHTDRQPKNIMPLATIVGGGIKTKISSKIIWAA